MPFFAEEMYQQLKLDTMPESVHLCAWPELKGEGQTDLELESKMDEVRSIVTLALAERSAKAIKVKQPLKSIKIKNQKSKIKDSKELLDLIKDEANIKEVIFDAKIKGEIELDTNITEELKEEGLVREVIRHVQDMRKSMGLKPVDKISLFLSGDSKLNKAIEGGKEFVLRETRAKEIYISEKPNLNFDLEKETLIDNNKLFLAVKKL